MKPKIILASASKRRSKILSECGIPHRVVVSGLPEKIERGKGPEHNTVINAVMKVLAVAKKFKTGYVIGADTLVLLGRRIIGKPKSKKEAEAFLKAFSGKSILVYTGLCVMDIAKKRYVAGLDVSKLKVKRLSDKQITSFLKVLGPHDKAGGFSIEGAGSLIFDDIVGSFYNILGLPMEKLYELFEKLGVDLLKFMQP